MMYGMPALTGKYLYREDNFDQLIFYLFTKFKKKNKNMSFIARSTLGMISFQAQLR